MNEHDVTTSIAYCGQPCMLCEKANYCRGCKSKDASSSRHASREGCWQYECCQKKGIQGCWECDDAPCELGMFQASAPLHYRVFTRFAKYEGEEELGHCVFQNQIHGIRSADGLEFDACVDEHKAMAYLKRYRSNE